MENVKTKKMKSEKIENFMLKTRRMEKMDRKQTYKKGNGRGHWGEKQSKVWELYNEIYTA